MTDKISSKPRLFNSVICGALQPKKKPTPNALPAQSTHHSSIKRNHEASQCCFNKLSVSLLPPQLSDSLTPRPRSHQKVYKLFTLHWFVKPTTRPQMGESTDGHCYKLPECRWPNIREDPCFLHLFSIFLENRLFVVFWTVRHIINLSIKQCPQCQSFLWVTLFSCLSSHCGFCFMC